MKVARVGARRQRVELPPGAPLARRPHGAREALWLLLSDEDGHRGLGEAAPLPGLSREDLEAVERAWAGLPARFETPEVAEPGRVPPAWAERHDLPPSLRFAIETALLDLAARRAGRSFEALLGGPARSTQRTARLVTELGELDELQLEEGEAVKLKIGRPGAELEELAALRRFRTAAGAAVELRLDANEGFAPEVWRALAPALAELRPAWVEDPVPAAAWVELPASPVPLAIDAPLSREAPRVVERLLARSDVRAAILKPSLLGGLGAARGLAEVQARAGRAVVYSHLYEGRVGYSALAAASLSDPAATVAAGLGPHPGLGPRGDELERRRGRTLVPGAGPGLGLEAELAEALA